MEKNKLLIIDGSRRVHIDNTLQAIDEIRRMGPVQEKVLIDADFVDKLAARSYNRERRQVNTEGIVRDIHSLFDEKYPDFGKMLILDQDLYSTGLNWCFGVCAPWSNALGYIVLSTKRMASENHFRDYAKHELGHLFGAPSDGRRNTTESLGTHCTNDLCVMQQKLTVPESIAYVNRRARSGADTYCHECKRDIFEFMRRK